MKRDWKSTIGGAFSALGTSLIGIGVVPQLAGSPSKMLLYVAVAGFFCQGIGSFFGHLFAADASALDGLKQQLAVTTNAVRTGDTTLLTKPDAMPPSKP